jgi:hypothetical protein
MGKPYIEKNSYFYKKADMAFEKTYEVQKNNQLIIKLPDRFKTKKRVRVIVEDVDDIRDEKIKLLNKASKDPLFLSDIDEISKDFEISDKELS